MNTIRLLALSGVTVLAGCSQSPGAGGDLGTQSADLTTGQAYVYASSPNREIVTTTNASYQNSVPVTFRGVSFTLLNLPLEDDPDPAGLVAPLTSTQLQTLTAKGNVQSGEKVVIGAPWMVLLQNPTNNTSEPALHFYLKTWNGKAWNKQDTGLQITLPAAATSSGSSSGSSSSSSGGISKLREVHDVDNTTGVACIATTSIE